MHYTRILVVHLAAEQKRDRLHKDDQMTQIQFKVARGQMKQAFLAPPVCCPTYLPWRRRELCTNQPRTIQ